MKKMTHMLAGAMLLSSGASVMAAEDATVAIGDLTWTGAQAIGHVIQAVIEGPLGSEAKIVAGLSDGSIIAAGMDKGDGSADVYTDLWMPNRQALWDEFIDGAQTVGHNSPYLGTQKMYVPSYMSDRITSMEDLKDPEIAAMFDKDGNGKGEYWAGDAGWKSTRMWQVKFKSYGLSELWEPEVLPDATFKAQLKTAVQREQPIMFYYWTPEWVHAAYDLTAIEEPARTEGCEDVDLDKEDWLEASSFACASKDAEIFVAYSKSLETRNPPVAKFLSQVQLDPAVVNGWILKIGRDKLDPRDVAEEWVAENMDVVNEWIK
ncbi:glycine betaine ABC transporter substrate-binding protein [Roseovarius nubinhibens]|uniref:Glycine/betaine ABC transporter substrate-binding protein n=1 Tax=Roseovarius nubinhibens TaxID=314263 RepID=A0A348WGP4_9RHOB|nr:glycine/betaine ABC transporter substrate-binding protein [Roseovarius nubinhibens]|tara:strand:+ start:13275 stop:14231 length:957 start_codon:yes stop_codon:yes gene_type:complete